jgi:LPXTG-motif cell wall-anchored protein
VIQYGSILLYKKEDNIMINALMLIAANSPQTGDTFPRGVILIIIIAAVILAVGTAVFAKKKGGNDDEDDDE